MRKKLPIGVSDFKRILDDNYYYIDKTLLIKEITLMVSFSSLTVPGGACGDSLFLPCAVPGGFSMGVGCRVY